MAVGMSAGIERIESGLWVLRRWNSYTPRIPTFDAGPGGGYFLKWKGKGFAIDPGFNFLLNMERARLYLSDINAVVITHSHPDHTDDFEPILMMMARQHERRRQEDRERGKLDLFLSMDTTEKYHYLLQRQSPDVINQSKSPDLDSEGIKKLPEYCAVIQTLPADHAKTHSGSTHPTGHSEQGWAGPLQKAVSIIFHLYTDKDLVDSKRCLSIGFTGDTRYSSKTATQMKQCEIVVAHLGSLEFGPLIGLVAKNSKCKVASQMRRDLQEYGGKPDDENAMRGILGLGHAQATFKKELDQLLKGQFPANNSPSSGHLLFLGILDLFKDVFSGDSKTKIGIVSEFGLELGSFRHKIAQSLNVALFGNQDGRGDRRIISGDRDLAVQLSDENQTCAHSVSADCKHKDICDKGEARFLLRCTLCHDWFCLPCIKEHSISHRDRGIFYNCDVHWKREDYPGTPVIEL